MVVSALSSEGNPARSSVASASSRSMGAGRPRDDWKKDSTASRWATGSVGAAAGRDITIKLGSRSTWLASHRRAARFCGTAQLRANPGSRTAAAPTHLGVVHPVCALPKGPGGIPPRLVRRACLQPASWWSRGPFPACSRHAPSPAPRSAPSRPAPAACHSAPESRLPPPCSSGIRARKQWRGAASPYCDRPALCSICATQSQSISQC